MNFRYYLSCCYFVLKRYKFFSKSRITTVLMRLRFYFANASIGKGAVFYGKSYLQVHPQGTLICGNFVVFRSSEESNSIGLKQRCFLSVGKNAKLTIGNDCGLSGCVVNALLSVEIGNRVFLGANVTISDSDRHPIDATQRASGKLGPCAAITIGDDVWVGMNSVILKGAIIGSNVVIGANSLVTGHIPSNSIAFGSPAKVIKQLGGIND